MIEYVFRPIFWAKELTWRADLKKDSEILVIGNEEEMYVSSFINFGLQAFVSSISNIIKKGKIRLSQSQNMLKCIFFKELKNVKNIN